MGASLRYLGCALGFGFGVVWTTVGLGAAIVCFLVAALGYGAVFVAERAQASHPRGTAAEFGSDSTTPLSADADGWPWPWTGSGDGEGAEQEHAAAAPERT